MTEGGPGLQGRWRLHVGGCRPGIGRVRRADRGSAAGRHGGAEKQRIGPFRHTPAVGDDSAANTGKLCRDDLPGGFRGRSAPERWEAPWRW